MRIFLLIIVAVFCLAVATPGSAEIFALRSGGHITGKLINVGQVPRVNYVIETDSGIRLKVAASQVRFVGRPSSAQQEYQRLAPTMADTAEGHWKLAQWCTQQRLLSEREHHLEMVIQYDPNHAEARRLLGYRKKDGQWMTRADVMQERGYVHYDGRWRTPQDIAIREAKRKREEAEIEWKIKLRRWYDSLTRRDADLAEQARRSILSSKDPHAAPPLRQLLDEARIHPVRLLLIDALANNLSGTATAALMDRAVRDADREVRERAIDALVDRKHPDMVRELAKALTSNDNREVNRAANVLAALEYESAISPLIDALVTTHKATVSGGPNIQAGMQPGRGGGFAFGGGGPKVFKRQAQNRDVLAALVKLSGGQSFDFNESAWRAWYSNKQKAQVVDIRRD